MARIKMIHAAASVRNQPHSPLDNVNTPFDSMRLIKGAPPGRERVQHYTSELGIVKGHTNKYNNNQRNHLFGIQAYGDFDYHYKLYEGSADRDYKFYQPDLIADYVRKM